LNNFIPPSACRQESCRLNFSFQFGLQERTGKNQRPGLSLCDNFELNDWRGCFLDANTPRPGLLDLIREKHPDGVTLLLTAYFNLESLLPTAGILPAVACGIPAARPKSKEHP